jgi:hypothetical protein
VSTTILVPTIQRTMHRHGCVKDQSHDHPLRAKQDPSPSGARSAPASLDIQLENAVSDALWHPLDPEVIREPPGLADEDRRAALLSVTGRFAAAVGVSAIVALFFVIMLPSSRLPDSGSTTSGILQSMKSALLQPGQRGDESKPAITDFQTLLASAQTSQPATHAQSEQLLQQFLQWRQKPNSAEVTR